MAEYLKTLVFTNKQDIKFFGRFAHPYPVTTKPNQKWEWGGSSIPLLMTAETTLKDLRKYYKGLNFREVELVEVTVTINTRYEL